MDSFNSDDYAYLLENYKRLIQDQDYEIDCKRMESLAINNAPITLQDPYNDHPENTVKFPYLRRGAGLNRYGMSIDHFKEPPDLYKKKSFKSFTQQKPANINFTKPEKTIKSQNTKFINPGMINRKSQNIKKPPERVFALTASKAFDDEIVPALRHRQGESFDVPIPETFFNRIVTPIKSNLPKTPIQNLVLKNDENNLPEEIPENAVSRRLTYEPQIIIEETKNKNMREREEENTNSIAYCEIVKDIPKRNGLDPEKTDFQNKVHNRNEEDSSDLEQKANNRKIAEAMKRKGLTDNVKKHLGWNTPPKKRHPICIIKKVKVKKSKPKKKETLNIHELKDRLKQLEEEKNKFQIENYKIKKLEKNFIDEKLKLDKLRKELENKIKDEKYEIEVEKEKLFEDQKKFRREKLAFEKYSQETKSLPSREDREQIRTLKMELETLKEVLKTKEARNGALLAQLRSRIVLLERENKELKEDLEDAAKVTLKKVRFETEGRVKGKIIDAINKQLDLKVKDSKTQQKPLSAREKSAMGPKLLRRSKSAVELKPSLVKTRCRVLSNGGVPIKSNEPIAAKISDVEVDDQLNDDVPEVIDLIGDKTSDIGKDSEYDSGLDSRPSSSEDCSLRQGCIDSAQETYSEILEIRRRVGNLLGEKHAPEDVRSLEVNNRNSEDLNENMPTSNVIHNSRNQEFVCGNVCDFRTTISSHNITPDFCSNKANVPNLSTSRVNFNDLKKSDLICSRHGVAIVETIRRTTMGQNVTMDRNIVRTELRNGDVEEEEIHSGVRRMYCGQCGSCETTYRTNPGYRRTTTSEGNTMEEHPDGKRVCRYKSGEIVHEYPYGVKVIVMPNGEREITKPGSKTLERPDGIVRTVYDDGRQETRYPSGRVRIKNRFGHLIMDTGGLAY